MVQSQAIERQDVSALPRPRESGGLPLFDALRARHSTRMYSERALSPQQLSDLLWAAFGVNRPSGDRTAPYWKHVMVIDIYVAKSDGVWLYEPKSHTLIHHQPSDIRAQTGLQDFVGNAAVNLIYVAHGERMTDISTEERRTLCLGRRWLHGAECLSVLRLRGACNSFSGRGRRRKAGANIATAGRSIRHLRADGWLRSSLARWSPLVRHRRRGGPARKARRNNHETSQCQGRSCNRIPG